MKKKIFLVLSKLPLIAVITVLLSALFLNLSTLWAVDKIQRGGPITSGYFCAIIGSGSMEPTVFVNDLLLIKSEASYRSGDIITYVSPRGGLITHRVKEVSDYGYIAQGDSNNIPDEEISKQRALGKVVFVIPRAGGVIDGILSPAGIALLGCICSLLWLIQRIRRNQNEDDWDTAEDSFEDTSENQSGL